MNFASISLFFHGQRAYRFNWREDVLQVTAPAHLVQMKEAIIERAVGTDL